ncbi:1-phosphatidylinositol 4-kinase [Lachancea thermotolerans CBS 6340]|uniref:1-phosphatidylinositol 4-kinase n=1 Tax=Lachancea thermotolerans (strain ATCC 56472 / CBS 6340 / NRRL Y-8284) TaxID=559295 RepID=C5DK79_LACTC|nr:KLTH0F02442p [Lachancea thermotolerans CBS 6340]CAR23880.1 KLTH0F02442p [Lachancea thermotolerans CBS 6340]
MSETAPDSDSSDLAPSTSAPGSNQLLLKFINSAHFTLYNNIEYLTRYSQNIGIHFYLCQKLLTFPHNELQFYIPQLVQVLLTVETESIALEELLLKLSAENPHFALLTFWQLQALLGDLSTDPSSYAFQVARRVINSLQNVLFNPHKVAAESEKIHENVAPALVLCSMVIGSCALPGLGEFAKPLVQSQGKRQKSYVFKLAKNAMRNLTKNLTLKNTLLNQGRSSSNGSHSKESNALVELVDGVTTREDTLFKKPREKPLTSLNFDMIDDVGEKMFQERISNSIKMPKRKSRTTDQSYVHRIYQRSALTGASDSVYEDEYTNSMPDLHKEMTNNRSTSSLNSLKSQSGNESEVDDRSIKKVNSDPLADDYHDDTIRIDTMRRRSRQGKDLTTLQLSQLSIPKKIRILKSNYFRCETQLAIALESISQRLAQVPSEARLSALRAELLLLNRDLPAEVDIPTLLPPNKKGKLHKLVKITANEAQVLNSAEKVPFLLLIEYLRDEMDFDPTTEENENVLRRNPGEESFIFDLASITKDANSHAEEITAVNEARNSRSSLRVSSTNEATQVTSEKEVDLGDVSVVNLTNHNEAETYRRELMVQSAAKVPVIPNDSTNRNPELQFLNNLEEIRSELEGVEFGGPSASSAEDLATQMRISAVMLAQLDKSPQQLHGSTNQIRAKIIASMQEVQDRFGFQDLEAIHGMAGQRKLENDLKTGGLQGTKKDMSYLGENWNAKKERIRATSEFGEAENWDLCSVIAKSGDDLRQEAFACQMIQAMANIWAKENVGVWVKKMKILITSANTGLVETITNAMSVHSIKKSLTQQMVENGELNEKGQIASLKDHFARAYGDPTEFKYSRARDNFAFSLAAYSIICYVLQVKDRHNGNIMVDNEGHVVHIDFGFMLSNSPGSVGFEAAPFKLTYEYVDLLGGLEAEPYKKFVRLTKDGFKALRKYADQLVSMCEIMQKDNMQPCFNAGEQTSAQLRQRFHLELTEQECDDFVENVLVGKSLGSIYTRLYDQFQLISQGIYS